MTVAYFDKVFRSLKFFESTVIEHLLFVFIPLFCLLLFVFRREAPIARAPARAKARDRYLKVSFMSFE